MGGSTGGGGRRKSRQRRMTRKVNGKQSEIKVTVKLTYNDHPKVAFLSGVNRDYYPQDPGRSKFGLVYQIHFGDDIPECKFYPPVDRLQKPISSKGYGIAGLSARRFPKVTNVDYPSPDKYQQEINPPELPAHRRPLLPADDFYRLTPKDPLYMRQKLKKLAEKNRQCILGFGSLNALPRFGKAPTFNTAGVGSYNASDPKPPRIKINASFGRSPLIRRPSCEIRCVFKASEERCIECRKVLDMADHYRTRYPIEPPLPESHPVPEDFPKGIKSCVNICNVCYYRAVKGHSKNWPKGKLGRIFKKVRTCATIHEHNDLPELVHKVNCQKIRRLQLKEAILAKHYPDRVEESIIALEKIQMTRG